MQADVVYKVNEYWDKASERSLNWNDKKSLMDGPQVIIRKSFKNF